MKRRGGVVGAAAAALAAVPVGLQAAGASYLGLLTLAATSCPAGRPGPGAAATRFAVLVPAHDEARLIGATVAGLRSMDYPTDRFRVYVVADHCTDDTAALAARAGAEVLEHVDPEPRGKGAALRWAMARIDPEADVVVIVDADTVAEPDLLRALDARFAGGARVVQATYAVHHLDASPVVALREAALAVRHHLRPLGRVSIGASCGLFGNGMAFHRDVLAGVTVSDHLTEDLELGCELVLRGERIDFAPEATVRAEMPDSLEGAATQNERWERGRIDVARRYVARLVGSALRPGARRRIARLDAAADLLIPPLSVNVVFSVASTAVAWVVAIATSRRRSWWLAAISAASSGILVVHVLAALRLANVSREVYRSLAAAPRVVWWKTMLWLRMLVGREDVAWQRTARNEP